MTTEDQTTEVEYVILKQVNVAGEGGQVLGWVEDGRIKPKGRAKRQELIDVHVGDREGAFKAVTAREWDAEGVNRRQRTMFVSEPLSQVIEGESSADVDAGAAAGE